LFKAWPPAKLVRFGAIVLAVVIPSMLWLGPAWIGAIASLPNRVGTNASLKAFTALLGLSPFWLVIGWIVLFGVSAYVIWRGKPTLSRSKAGFLMCMSLLLAPYAEGNSVVTVIAIGIVPLFLLRPWRGALLILLTDVPFLIPAYPLLAYSALYWVPVLVLAWALLGWEVYQAECKPTAELLGQRDIALNSPGHARNAYPQPFPPQAGEGESRAADSPLP